jgi:methyl-accepting chemotaxis protein
MAAYLRKMAIEEYVIRLELPEIGELTGQLGKVGSNINQIARRVNSIGHGGIEEIRLARKALEEIRDGINRILTRLSSL